MDMLIGISIAITNFISPNLLAADCYLRQWYNEFIHNYMIMSYKSIRLLRSNPLHLHLYFSLSLFNSLLSLIHLYLYLSTYLSHSHSLLSHCHFSTLPHITSFLSNALSHSVMYTHSLTPCIELFHQHFNVEGT